MSTGIAIGLIIIPLLATIIIGISFDRWFRSRGSKEGDLLQKYLSKER